MKKYLQSIALKLCLLLVGLTAIDQVLQLALLSDHLFLGRRVAPFDPPLFSPSQQNRFEQIAITKQKEHYRFDPDLGWRNPPSSGTGDFTYDWAGSRIAQHPLAQAKDPAQRRILALGCSMTHGEEVTAQATWLALVDDALADVEIANLGVAAYGIDQALLRLIREGPALDGDEVWLGFLPAAALRVTTRYRPLVDHWSLDIAFKPRFFLVGGELELLPCPIQSLSDAVFLLSNQQGFLDAVGPRDPWITRIPQAYAPRGTHWTHFLFTSRLVLTLLEGRGRNPMECFDDRSNEVYSLLRAIVLQSAEEARVQGCTFRLLILPGQSDLEAWKERGIAPWAEWSNDLRSQGISILDLSDALISKVNTLYAPYGHYSNEGNQVVAGAIIERLELEGD